MAKFKLLLIVLTVMVIGGGIFLTGLSTLYNEHRLSSHGKSAEVIRVLPELGQNGDLYSRAKMVRNCTWAWPCRWKYKPKLISTKRCPSTTCPTIPR
jgi:hypothetical protein